MGVLNLKKHNETLLLKYLHNFINKEDIPWVKLFWECYHNDGRIHRNTKKGPFWWKDLMKPFDKYRGMALVQIQDGRTCLLWDVLWGIGIPKL